MIIESVICIEDRQNHCNSNLYRSGVNVPQEDFVALKFKSISTYLTHE